MSLTITKAQMHSSDQMGMCKLYNIVKLIISWPVLLCSENVQFSLLSRFKKQSWKFWTYRKYDEEEDPGAIDHLGMSISLRERWACAEYTGIMAVIDTGNITRHPW